MTSSYHGSKISGSEQSFFTRRLLSLSNDGRTSWATFLFLSAIMHRKVIHVNFFLFFPAIFTGQRFVEIQKFLLPWECDVTTFPLY